MPAKVLPIPQIYGDPKHTLLPDGSTWDLTTVTPAELKDHLKLTQVALNQYSRTVGTLRWLLRHLHEFQETSA